MKRKSTRTVKIIVALMIDFLAPGEYNYLTIRK